MNSNDFLWAPPSLPYVSIRNSDRQLPVRRIFCVGRNYQAHAIEMGTPVDKSTMRPFYFIKDAGSLLTGPPGTPVPLPYPPATENFHHEVELVVALGRGGFRLQPEQATALIYGYAAGLDMTRRDLQQQAKDLCRPWDLAKNFEYGAVCSEIVPAEATGLLAQGAISLQVNEEPRQHGDLSQMIWNISELVADLSHFYHLEAGDLLFTGTPEGVGPVKVGDHLRAEIDGVGNLEAVIV